MPRKAPAEMALAKGFAFVNNGLSRREALARQLDPQTLEEILKALVEKAKGCCVEKQVVDLRGNTQPQYYTISPDPKAIRIVLEISGAMPETVGNLMAIIARARKDVALSEMVAHQKQFIVAQTERTHTESEAYRAAAVSPVDVEEAFLHFSTSIIGRLQSIPREEMLDEYCPTEETYQKLARMMSQFVTNTLAVVLDELRGRVIPPALGSIQDDKEQEDARFE
jgi:hypothetical protein